MARAIWEGAVIAESAEYEKLEGNVYFPPEAVKREHLRPLVIALSAHHRTGNT